MSRVGFPKHRSFAQRTGPESLDTGVNDKGILTANRLTCEYDWFAQVLEHETQCRAGVSKRIGAMEDNEAVEQRIIAEDGLGDLGPSFAIDG